MNEEYIGKRPSRKRTELTKSDLRGNLQLGANRKHLTDFERSEGEHNDMAYDAFMWLKGGSPDANGETTDIEFSPNKAFEIYSFSFGASNPTTVGSAIAKVSISAFNIMKKTDSASPALFLNCCKGQHFTEGHIVLRKAGATALKFLTYDFKEVYVASIQWNGSSGGDDTPTESVSFAFGEVGIKYTPQRGGTPIPAGWDLTQNVAAPV